MLANSKWFGDFDIDSESNRSSMHTHSEFSYDTSLPLSTGAADAPAPAMTTSSRCASDSTTTTTNTLDSVLRTPDTTTFNVLEAPPHIRTVDSNIDHDVDADSCYSDYQDPSTSSYSNLKPPPIPDSPVQRLPKKRPSLSSIVSHIHGPKLWYKKSIKKLRGHKGDN